MCIHMIQVLPFSDANMGREPETLRVEQESFWLFRPLDDHTHANLYP